MAREIVWRAQREWNKRLIYARLERPGQVEFRCVPYYKPDLQAISEHSRGLIVAFADEICAGRYPFLGHRTADLGRRPRWNLDFQSGAEWLHLTYEDGQYIRYDSAEVKVPLELSRLQFLPVIGKAHVLTKDDSYRRTAKDLLSHWIRSNPVPAGVNWTIAMEAALRAMSICFLLNLLSPFHGEERPWLATVTRSLFQHLLYIEANIEFSHFLTSNHYLSNVVGLYCLSMFLDGEGMAARRGKYRKCIETEMARQVYEDGGDYEASIGYQVLVTQFFTTALLLMRTERSTPVTPAFAGRLAAMFLFLNTVASSAGELPHVGDCDDGRVELLLDDVRQMLTLSVPERNSLRVSNLLGLGKCLLNQGCGSVEDAKWYGLGDTTRTQYSQPQISLASAPAIQVLPNSGIGVLRHRSAEMLFFAVPNGIFGKGSHTHNDKLSFVLRVGGQEILCDSGTGCYSRDIATRNRFRSTASHNTLRVDGVEQNSINPGPHGLFNLGNEAAATPIGQGRDVLGSFLRASHSGYRSLGITHTRTIHLVVDESVFVIDDELDGHGAHDFELNLQLPANRTAELAPVEDVILCHIPGKQQVQIKITGPAGLQAAIQPSLISSTYGATVPAVKVRIWGRAPFPLRLTTRISWKETADTATLRLDFARTNKIDDDVAKGVCLA